MPEASGRPSLASVAYAKSAEHDRFLRSFEGVCFGRYHLACLVGIEILKGEEVRRAVEDELGGPQYLPTEMYPARDLIVICDRAVRAGIAMFRIGELIPPAYKRAHPEAFAGKTVFDAFDLLEHAYRTESTYGGVSPGHQLAPGLARVFRVGQPTPCDYFIGVVAGLLRSFGISGSVREAACQWEGAKCCCIEARWDG